jgi:hypothetical protein
VRSTARDLRSKRRGKRGFFFRSPTTSFAVDLSVSKTPMPVRATASWCGAPFGLSAASSSSSELTSGRSRLLYWMHHGIASRSTFCSARFVRRFSMLSMFASKRPSCESATKITASERLRMSLRLAS